MKIFLDETLKHLYHSIPDYLRYDTTFRHKYNFLQKSQYWDKNELLEYQLKQLKNILKHSYQTVPYYTSLFDEYGIKISDIKDFRDLKKIPYLTKDIIRDNMKSLISTLYEEEKLQYVTTGGTTGIPLGFYRDEKYDKSNEWAFITNMWSRVGYNVYKTNRCVILRGNIIKKGIYEYKNKDLILSSFKLDESNMKQYINLIKNFNPDFIQAYPSSIILLSNYINQTNEKINCNNLKSIICASENFNEKQRKEIETAFNVKMYSFYGHTEHACIGGECEKSNFYHLQSEYGYTEIINDKENYVEDENELGEIVATGFNNYAMPFIRYKTCDIAVNTNKKCNCNRNYKLIKKIDGRKQEYFIDKENKKIIFTWADYPLWNIKDKIIAYQYIQTEPGKVKLNIQFKLNVKKTNFDNIKKIFNEYYPNIYIEIENVNYIERTKRGKFKYLIQTVK